MSGLATRRTRKPRLLRAADLLRERGKHGLHRQVADYFRAESCEVIDFASGEQRIYKALRRNPHGKGMCDMIVLIPAGRKMRAEIEGPYFRLRYEADLYQEFGRHSGLTVLFPRGLCGVIAIEIKRPRGSRTSLEQAAFRKRCLEIGCPYAVIKSLEEAKAILPPGLEERR